MVVAMQKVEIKVEGTKILWIQPGIRLLSEGAPFVEYTHGMLGKSHVMNQYPTPVMMQLLHLVVPHMPADEFVTIEPLRFRFNPPTKAVWEDLLPAVIGVIQSNAHGKVGVRVIGRDQWPMWILGKKR